MSSPTAPKSTVAIFGATGGTGLSVLKNCLAAGHTVNVLARTPSKLSSLASQYPNLRIIHGDIHDVSSIKETLLMSPANGKDKAVVDIVVSGIGMVLQRKGLSFTSSGSSICETGTQNILSALRDLEAEKAALPRGGPRLILLSTTGISSKSRDIPIAMMPLYYWMLVVPHADKKKMEEAVVGSGRRWVLVRPSFLLNGEAKGLSAVRTSVEVPGEKMGEGEEHAVGYVIRREDVGGWIFEECVRGDEEKWLGKCVSLTY